MNKQNTTKYSRRILLAIMLITVLWMTQFFLTVTLNLLCEGGYFWKIMLLTLPITMVNMKTSGLIWRYYC